ncbi:hypothetical protein F2P81_009240 [Scophthalmus maximus]|uniref:Uncharacterized protein n=1 Tax=Scophthalmus maximus TaxID=52904 RepID=A0A6A4SU48_SCOMX|nr:hypothetical protein F2P81_009240 [Scophthalmus maximus]
MTDAAFIYINDEALYSEIVESQRCNRANCLSRLNFTFTLLGSQTEVLSESFFILPSPHIPFSNPALTSCWELIKTPDSCRATSITDPRRSPVKLPGESARCGGGEMGQGFTGFNKTYRSAESLFLQGRSASHHIDAFYANRQIYVINVIVYVDESLQPYKSINRLTVAALFTEIVESTTFSYCPYVPYLSFFSP